MLTLVLLVILNAVASHSVSTGGQKECERARSNAENALGAFVPNCNSDGLFEERQCHGSTGYCWCVDPNSGIEIKGTRKGPGQGKVTCARKCKAIADVGFIMDSSGSVANSYQTEKNFVKSLAAAFDISKDGTRVSVIIFSVVARLMIKFKYHFNIRSFNAAVDALPLMTSLTRIDLALRTAQEQMFKTENGARVDTPKILILLTDASQTKGKGDNPVDIANKLRQHGIHIIVIGVGAHIKHAELENIAGSSNNVFNAASFDELVSAKFIDTLTKKSCKEVARKCKKIADVGFIMDSSGSVANSYQMEKNFVKSLAAAFDISKDGSRVSVIIFSVVARLMIKFKYHFNIRSFNAAVDAIPFMGSLTRIDLALRTAEEQMFKTENGARVNTPKILILLTDASQTKDIGENPAVIANKLRRHGIHIIVIGVGAQIKHAELENIGGSSDNVFNAASFDELISAKFIDTLTKKSCKEIEVPTARPPTTPARKCKAIADVGFLMDSSGSVANSYQTEKNFVKSLAAAFDISKDGPRVSVIIFSLVARLMIKFKDHFDTTSFNTAVDAIPLMGRLTRIDLALRTAEEQMFKTKNGARVNTPKILIVLTDASQTEGRGQSPVDIAQKLRQHGIHIIVIGVGAHINRAELENIAGNSDNVFNAASFDELISAKFIDTLTKKSCKEVEVPTTRPPTTPAKVNGNWGAWQSYGACSKSCGGGIQTRSRSCNNPAPGYGGKPCSGKSSETQACNAQNCPVNGHWGAWESYGACSKSCGGGIRTRSRSCNNPAPAHGGKPCSGKSEQTRNCNARKCPVNGNWSEWGAYGKCSKSCGGGTQERSRSCTNPPPSNGGASCTGKSHETRPCGNKGCPVNGNWSKWGAYGKCSKSCGGGTQERSRSCTNPAPSNGGASCTGKSQETRPCGNKGCPVNGNWSEWGAYGKCSKSCGGGTQEKSRSCTNPAPSNGGASCSGKRHETRPCGVKGCPVNGNWGEWEAYGKCSKSCGGGTQERSRSCNNPAPSNGGASCTGKNHETRLCGIKACPVNGKWTPWGNYGKCSKFCGDGVATRTRTCTNPAPANGGSSCSGKSSETKTCNVEGNQCPGYGWCLNMACQDQNDGDENVPASSKEDCLAKCLKFPGALACEWSGRFCTAHTQPVSRGSGEIPSWQRNYSCWVFAKCDV